VSIPSDISGTTAADRAAVPPAADRSAEATRHAPRVAAAGGGLSRGDESGRRRTTAAPSLAAVIGRTGLIHLVLCGAAVLWVFWDQCVRIFRIWRDNPDWSHGFLIPLFSLYFIHTQRARLAAAPRRTNWLGLAVLAAAVFGYIVAVYVKIGYPQSAAVVLAIFGLVLLLCGEAVLFRLAFPLGFLLLAMPPPDYLYRQITQPLQQMAAFFSMLVLRLLPGVWVERAGFNLTYILDSGREGSFAVAGACSGMRSLMAFVALGLAMAYFAPRPTWQRVTMAVVIIPVALFCNIVRVIVTGAFAIYDYGNLAAGTPHTVLGLLTFALGFCIYFVILFILDRLFIADEEPAGAWAGAAQSDPRPFAGGPPTGSRGGDGELP